MLHVLAAPVYLGFAFLIYRLILKRRERPSLTKKTFLLALAQGALPCTICIAAVEILFDSFILKSEGLLWQELLTAFVRAALIEEGFKLVFSRAALNRFKPETKLEYMLLCGMIGAGYGLSEKLAFGGGIILVVNAFLPLHIFFQFLMGAFLFEADRAKRDGDAARLKRMRAAAFLAPFLVHGAWDALLAVAGYLLDAPEESILPTLGLVMFLALVAGGILCEVRTVKRMRETA